MAEEIDYKDIDPRLRPLITELNANGLTTFACCAGHQIGKTNNFTEGYVMFVGKPKQSKVKEVFKAHGIDEVIVDPRFTTYRFNGLGGSKARRRSLKHAIFINSAKEQAMLLRLFSKNLDRLGIHHFSTVNTLAEYALSNALNGAEIPRDTRLVGKYPTAHLDVKKEKQWLLK